MGRAEADLAAARRALGTALVAHDGARARAVLDGALEGAGAFAVQVEVLAPVVAGLDGGDPFGAGILEGLLARAAGGTHGSAGGVLAVVACPPGQPHTLQCRLVADVLEGRGWEVIRTELGTGARGLVDHVSDEQPDAVVITFTACDALDGARELLGALTTLDPGPLAVPLDAGGCGLEGAVTDLPALVDTLHAGVPPYADD